MIANFQTQIAYASTSSALSDRSIFKSFFRNTFNMQIMAPALRSAVAYFNWTRIAMLTQDEHLFSEVNIGLIILYIYIYIIIGIT